MMFSEDTMVFPKESEHFGFYSDDSYDTAVNYTETLLYKEDWVGFKELVDTNRVAFVTVPGDHL